MRQRDLTPTSMMEQPSHEFQSQSAAIISLLVPLSTPIWTHWFFSRSSRRTRVSPAWGENRQETRLYAIALETGAEGKTDLETCTEAGPGHQDGERFLTIISLLNQTRLGAWKKKKRKVSAWMSHGLIDSCGST